MSTKVEVIRCRKTEPNYCGSHCFKATTKNGGSFQEIESPQIVGFVSCGGCLGNESILRAENIVERDAEVLVFTTCVTKGSQARLKKPVHIPKKIGDTVNTH